MPSFSLSAHLTNMTTLAWACLPIDPPVNIREWTETSTEPIGMQNLKWRKVSMEESL
jgi:hypothetical protein